MFWSGYLGDKLNVWLAKRRNGTHIPEDSLVILIFPTIVSMIGIVVYALAADRPESHSSWGIIMGTSHPHAFVSNNADICLRMDSLPVRIYCLYHHVNPLRCRGISE